MRASLLAALVVLLWSWMAGAQTVPDDGRWQAVAQPPRETLPAVAITLGEPGPYVSISSSRIELQAVASRFPFDGHIGFHFEVAGRKTIDVPVVARATLAPHESWSFSTWVQLERSYPAVLLNRELVIEWRDRSMRVIGSANTGVPPWFRPRPLRVLRDEGTVEDECCLGETPSQWTHASLSDRAQWYAGFSDLVIDTDVWLDLPIAVREAIFGSGIHVMFVGTPREGQPMGELDRVFLPVQFEGRPARYVAPWPYRPATTAIDSNFSWRVKKASHAISEGPSPYMVTNGVTTFVADNAGLRLPIPVMQAWTPLSRGTGSDEPWMRPADILREYRSLLTAFGVFLLCIALWYSMRRRPSLTVVVVALLTAAGLFAARDGIRPTAAIHVDEGWMPQAPGVVRHHRDIHQYGPTPIGELHDSEQDSRTSVTGRGRVRQEAELRTSETRPGYGSMFLWTGGPAWDATSRWKRSRELGEPLKVRILTADERTFAFAFESAIPGDFVAARWVSRDRVHYGEARLGGRQKGEATIHAGRLIWPMRVSRYELGFDSKAHVSLISETRDRVAVVGWNEFPATVPIRDATRMRGVSHRNEHGTRMRAFALPAAPTGADSILTLQVAGVHSIKEVALEGSGGRTTDLSPSGTLRGHYVTEAGVLQRIAPNGGIIVVTLEPTDPEETFLPHIVIQRSEKH